MNRLLLFLFTLTIPSTLLAIEPDWNIGLQSIFDNREGTSDLTETKTVFFTALSPEAGLRFTSADRIAAGAVWTVPNVEDWKEHRLTPTIYYRHEGGKWNFSMGIFPRTQLREEMPEFLWTDSLAYFQKNIRGMLVQYSEGNSFVDLYLDWRQMQSETRREAFSIVLNGRWQKPSSIFQAGGRVMMNHYALTKNSPDDMHIIDNFMLNPYIGLDFSDRTSLDSLAVRAGALMTIERNRAHEDWSIPAGVHIDANAKWKWLGIRESFYCGGKLLPSFSEFGNSLYPGHPFYQEKLFSRTDLDGYIVTNKYVSLKAKLRFDIAPGQFVFSQLVTLDVALGGKF